MPNDLAFDIERYAALVKYLPTDEEPEDIVYTLLFRDRIHDALRAGAIPSVELTRQLAQADARLVGFGSDLSKRFPSVFEGRAPREHWWWHLDEGSPLCEQAKTHRDVA